MAHWTLPGASSLPEACGDAFRMLTVIQSSDGIANSCTARWGNSQWLSETARDVGIMIFKINWKIPKHQSFSHLTWRTWFPMTSIFPKAIWSLAHAPASLEFADDRSGLGAWTEQWMLPDGTPQDVLVFHSSKRRIPTFSHDVQTCANYMCMFIIVYWLSPCFTSTIVCSTVKSNRCEMPKFGPHPHCCRSETSHFGRDIPRWWNSPGGWTLSHPVGPISVPTAEVNSPKWLSPKIAYSMVSHSIIFHPLLWIKYY